MTMNLSITSDSPTSKSFSAHPMCSQYLTIVTNSSLVHHISYFWLLLLQDLRRWGRKAEKYRLRMDAKSFIPKSVRSTSTVSAQLLCLLNTARKCNLWFQMVHTRPHIILINVLKYLLVFSSCKTVWARVMIFEMVLLLCFILKMSISRGLCIVFLTWLQCIAEYCRLVPCKEIWWVKQGCSKAQN